MHLVGTGYLNAHIPDHLAVNRYVAIFYKLVCIPS